MAAPPITERHLHHFHRRSPIKEAVRVATTANITIATALNNGDSLDGITLATDDRVLVKDQSTGSQNGIYVVAASPARAYDQSTDDPAFGFLVFVREGTAGAQTLWRNTNTSTPTIDTTSIAFAQVAGTTAASAVSVADSAGYFTGTNVETVLAELGALALGVQAHGNTGAAETFSAVTAGAHSATLDANSTFTFTALASGLQSWLILRLTQDGTGSRTVTWPGSVVWPGGVAPTLSTAAAAVDILTFYSEDGGTTWYGFPTGGGGSALTVEDEGTPLSAAVTSIDFVGAGVTATGTTAVTVTIPSYTVTEADVRDAGRWERVTDPGSSAPPVDTYSPDGTEFVYSWVPA